MKELLGVENFGFATLNVDPTVTAAVATRIYIGEAPRERVYPLIVLNFPSFGDANYLGLDSRALSEVSFQVAVFSKSKTLNPVAGLLIRIDELFDRQFVPKSYGDAFIESCRRVGGYHLAEEDADGSAVQRAVQTFAVRSRRSS